MEPFCECGHVLDEHDPGGFFQPCTVCECRDFEGVSHYPEDHY